MLDGLQQNIKRNKEKNRKNAVARGKNMIWYKAVAGILKKAFLDG
jgi:hypothetical protein